MIRLPIGCTALDCRNPVSGLRVQCEVNAGSSCTYRTAMTLPDASLVVAAFLCSLVAGFLFAFAVVTMPGISRLRDREFIRAFQAMDQIIQNNQPLFVSVWVGSVVAVVVAVVLTLGHIDGVGRSLMIGSLVAYLLGVQVPTLAVNVPLNNRLQAIDVETADEASQASAREDFERRWNAFNVFRTTVACMVSITLMIVLARL